MDLLSLLDRHSEVLKQRDLTFDEKVGFILAKEAGTQPADKLPTYAGAIRNVLLGNQARLLKEAAARQTVQGPTKIRERKPEETRADVERQIKDVQDLLAGVKIDDPEAGTKYAKYGDRLGKLKEKMNKWSTAQ